MNIIKTIINNKSGHERKQARLKEIKKYINNIKYREEDYDIDSLINHLIITDAHITFQSVNTPFENKIKKLVRRPKKRN